MRHCGLVEKTGLRVLYIDDDEEWHDYMTMFMIGLQYERPTCVKSFAEAKKEITQAEQEKKPFLVAFVDMNFKVG